MLTVEEYAAMDRATLIERGWFVGYFGEIPVVSCPEKWLVKPDSPADLDSLVCALSESNQAYGTYWEAVA